MPSAASMILRACREASRAARSAASAASRCAAMVARSGLGGAAASVLSLRSPSQSRLSFGRDRVPIAASNPRSSGSGSTVATPPTKFQGPAPGKVEFVAEDKDLESDEALWALYERWCKAFNQKRDHSEMARRFIIFKESVLMVDETNKAGLPYRLGINEYSDGKKGELQSPKVPLIPMMEYYKRMLCSDSVINGRSGDSLFKKDLEGDHELKNPNQSV